MRRRAACAKDTQCALRRCGGCRCARCQRHYFATANEVTDRQTTEVAPLRTGPKMTAAPTSCSSDPMTALACPKPSGRSSRGPIRIRQPHRLDDDRASADDGSVGIVSIPATRMSRFQPTPLHPVRRSPASRRSTAFSIGGPSLAVETVERSTGVHIDHYAEINFQELVTMVDGPVASPCV